MLKIRWSRDHLIFNMGIPIPGKDSHYIETGPRFPASLRMKIVSHQEWGQRCQTRLLSLCIVRHQEWGQRCQTRLLSLWRFRENAHGIRILTADWRVMFTLNLDQSIIVSFLSDLASYMTCPVSPSESFNSMCMSDYFEICFIPTVFQGKDEPAMFTSCCH